ncbi:hypothetical protein BRM70_03170, partial [Xanthomonas oryzae pv. oryzae]
PYQYGAAESRLRAAFCIFAHVLQSSPLKSPLYHNDQRATGLGLLCRLPPGLAALLDRVFADSDAGDDMAILVAATRSPQPSGA